MQISVYDRVASWLISFLIVCGVLVGALFMIWIGPKLRYKPRAFDVVMEDEGYGRGDNPAGFARDSKAPGDPDIPMMDEPAGDELPELVESDFAATMDVVASNAAVTIAEVGDIAIDTLATTSVRGFRGTGGGEGGLGDSRPPGPLGDNPNVISKWERWEMQYTSSSKAAYARQLEFFKIELGAAGGKADIDYAFNLAKAKPDTRSGPSTKDKRLFLSWRSGPLKEFDRQILESAGINTRARIMLQFYPAELEKILTDLERQNAPGRSNREFLKTVFGVRPARGGFEFFIVEQRFRPAPK